VQSNMSAVSTPTLRAEAIANTWLVVSANPHMLRNLVVSSRSLRIGVASCLFTVDAAGSGEARAF
jgi:hypothetical protein